jgi:hypothetical protein
MLNPVIHISSARECVHKRYVAMPHTQEAAIALFHFKLLHLDRS